MTKDMNDIKDVDAVKSYFTKEFMAGVTSLSMDEMVTSLKELEGTKYWTAIVKYSQERLANAQQALITMDPFKEPTSMARYQGVMSCLLDLQEAVISLKAKADEVETPKRRKKKQNLDELGGAYSVI